MPIPEQNRVKLTKHKPLMDGDVAGRFASQQFLKLCDQVHVAHKKKGSGFTKSFLRFEPCMLCNLQVP